MAYDNQASKMMLFTSSTDICKNSTTIFIKKESVLMKHKKYFVLVLAVLTLMTGYFLRLTKYEILMAHHSREISDEGIL